MAGTKETMKRLRDEAESLRRRIADMQAELRGIERAIELLEGNGAPSTQTRRRRTNVKATVLKLLEDAQPVGLATVELLEKAQQQGNELDRGTVSSLLSRLKREGTLMHDGERYKIAPSPAPQPELKSVI